MAIDAEGTGAIPGGDAAAAAGGGGTGAAAGDGSLTAGDVLALLGLAELPREGGHFRRTYTAPLTLLPAALPAGYAGPRPLATAIYYLLARATRSLLHRLPGDEVYHHYAGDPVDLLRLWPDGTGDVARLGRDLRAGERPQLVVPGGVWQGSRLAPGGHHGWALLGTTVAPGYDDADYHHADRAALLAAYPAFTDLILDLTDPS